MWELITLFGHPKGHPDLNVLLRLRLSDSGRRIHQNLNTMSPKNYQYHIKQISPVTGLDRPRSFQEVKVPRFRDNSTGWL